MIDTITDVKITNLLDAMTPELLDTAQDASHTIAELILALADSDASLKTAQAECAHHQERLLFYNEAFATLLRLAMDSANDVSQLTKSLAVANTAVHEGQHKVDQLGTTIHQLNITISQLTTDLTSAQVFGKQDRAMFIEVCQERNRLHYLSGIMSHTCRKLRQERNKAEKQLLAERASTTSTESTAVQTDFILY